VPPNGIRIHLRIYEVGFAGHHGIQNVIEELYNLEVVDFIVKFNLFPHFLTNNLIYSGRFRQECLNESWFLWLENTRQ
jgi:hypothetical protein